jgi:hypothetical protein
MADGHITTQDVTILPGCRPQAGVRFLRYVLKPLRYEGLGGGCLVVGVGVCVGV